MQLLPLLPTARRLCLPPARVQLGQTLPPVWGPSHGLGLCLTSGSPTAHVRAWRSCWLDDYETAAGNEVRPTDCTQERRDMMAKNLGKWALFKIKMRVGLVSEAPGDARGSQDSGGSGAGAMAVGWLTEGSA